MVDLGDVAREPDEDGLEDDLSLEEDESEQVVGGIGKKAGAGGV
jgi:hypothetical protein